MTTEERLRRAEEALRLVIQASDEASRLDSAVWLATYGHLTEKGGRETISVSLPPGKVTDAVIKSFEASKALKEAVDKARLIFRA